MCWGSLYGEMLRTHIRMLSTLEDCVVTCRSTTRGWCHTMWVKSSKFSMSTVAACNSFGFFLKNITTCQMKAILLFSLAIYQHGTASNKRVLHWKIQCSCWSTVFCKSTVRTGCWCETAWRGGISSMVQTVAISPNFFGSIWTVPYDYYNLQSSSTGISCTLPVVVFQDSGLRTCMTRDFREEKKEYCSTILYYCFYSIHNS